MFGLTESLELYMLSSIGLASPSLKGKKRRLSATRVATDPTAKPFHLYLVTGILRDKQ
jgi:hypothetical protein